LEIREYLNLLKRLWWLPIILAVIFSIPAYVLTPNPTVRYRAVTTVFLSQGTTDLPDPSAISMAQRVATTYQQLMTSQTVLAEVVQNLGLNTSPDALRGQIGFELVSGTNLMQVAAIANNPDEAAAIANEVVRVFISRNSEQANNRYTQARESLESEIQDLQVKLGELQANALRQQWDIDDINQRIDTLDQIEKDGGQLNDAQRQELVQLRNQLIDLSLAQAKQNSELSQEQTRYQSLLKSLEDVKLLETETSDFMTVVEPANPGAPFSGQSRKNVNAMQAGIAGLVLGLGIIFLMEQFRTTVKSGAEVEQAIGVPTFGMIAEIKGASAKEKLIVARQPRSPIAEAYRVIRSNIDFARPDDAIRTLVITSSSPSEGKTITTANIAATMAQAGKRVILVDADLRRPTMHKIFNLSNSRGVTTAITMGRNGADSISDHLTRTNVDNLYLMPSGPLPPNPADILGSEDMVNLIKELRELADIVIFDSPPVLAVADPSLLARICDATLLVVLANSTRVDALKTAYERLSQSRANLMGVIMNRISASETGYYHYYYSHAD
jgi:capsular exopolysaccharide synthesis family protein